MSPQAPRTAAPLAGALAALLLPHTARAQNTAGDALPLGLPPAATILNPPEAAPLGAPAAPTSNRYQPSAPQPTGPGVPAWTFTPSIGLEELFSDNILQSQTHRQADLITAITPGLDLRGNTPRVDVTLQYHPTLELYADHGSADSVAQQLLGSGTATLIPDTLFVNARALAAVQPAGGGLGGLVGSDFADSPIGAGGLGSASVPAALALDQHNRQQTTSFSITPWVQHRFGDFGTGKIGLTLSTSSISGNSEANPIPGTVSGNQREQRGEATVQFRGGEAFGRVREFALLDAAQSTGTGVLQGARDDLATDWVGYAVNRFLTPFAELGVESISYNTAERTRIDDAVWELGAVLTPNPDSQISAGYGHHQGANSVDLRGYYALSARTRITASYTTSLGTDVQQIQSQLGLADFDQYGNAVDAWTGTPLFLGNGLLGTQNALFRTRTLALTALTRLDRDAVSVSLQRQHQSPVGNAPGTPGGVPETGSTFIASWIHDVSERTSVGASASYGRNSFSSTVSGGESFIAATAGVSYRVSESLTTTARYSYFDRWSDFAGRGFTDNIVLLGISKKF